MVVRLLVAVGCVGGAAVFVQPALAAPSCGGHAATIVGTAGDNTLHGTGGRDVIVGGRGGDEIYGHGGRDLVCGGGGGDRIQGGVGFDALYGNDGGDRVDGDSGSDLVSGGGGSDSLFGEAGDDRLRGGGRLDWMRGGPGDDRMHGGPGNDRFYPGSGDDVYEGGSGAMGDELRYGHWAYPVVVDFAGVSKDRPGDRDLIRDIEFVYGSRGDDSIAGNALRNRFFGGGGDDVIEGRGGDDFLFGEGGDDEVRGGPGRDHFYDYGYDASGFPLPSGNDILIGGDSNDSLVIGNGANSVHGGAGSDWFIGQTDTESETVSVDLAAGVATVGGEPNTVAGVENARGQCTELFGDTGPNHLICYPPPTGSGSVDGRGGDDTLEAENGDADGGPGFDRCHAATVVNCEATFRLAALPR